MFWTDLDRHGNTWSGRKNWRLIPDGGAVTDYERAMLFHRKDRLWDVKLLKAGTVVSIVAVGIADLKEAKALAVVHVRMGES